MKFWLSKNSEISLHEQLVRQIVLAIVSGDLRVGDRLPSVREMALRCGVHPNTIGAAYVWLQEAGWIEARRGSGVFVREKSRREVETVVSASQNELDLILANFLNAARERGFTPAQVASRLQNKLESAQIDEIILVENDAELRRILAFEIGAEIDLPVTEINLTDFAEAKTAITVGLAGTLSKLPPNLPQIKLNLNSAHNEMRGKERPAPNDLIGVASRCEMFLQWSRTMLVAAGIAAEQIVVRDAKLENWQHGLSVCAFVIADSLTARKLPGNARSFPLISAASLRDLRDLDQKF